MIFDTFRAALAFQPLPSFEKRGVEFKGGSLHDEFGGFGAFGGHVALLCLSFEKQYQEATVTVLLSVNSPALILSKNSGVKSTNRLKLAKSRPALAKIGLKNRLISAKNG